MTSTKRAVSSSSAFCTLFLFMAFSGSSSGQDCTSTSCLEYAQDMLGKLATANNELALNLHRSLSARSQDNVFFSPLSISTAFAMLFYGARGDTADELRNALGYNKADISDQQVRLAFNYLLQEVRKNGDPSNGYVLNTANSILVDNHLELVPDYKKVVENTYRASVQEVNFKDSKSVVSKINRWAKRKTNGKINNIVDELDASTVMVLLNAVYFKGTWEVKFSKEQTKPELFYNRGFVSKRVPMMHMTDIFRHAENLDCQALELPYKGDKISMLILLPHRRNGLATFEKNLSLERLSAIQNQLDYATVTISLPKFKVEYSKDLSEDFQNMGANSMFDAGSADFSGMSRSHGLAVTQVLHKAVVEVNEVGSEAAAATSTGLAYRRAVKKFTADHPFLFAIVENGSGAILFMGRVNQL